MSAISEECRPDAEPDTDVALGHDPVVVRRHAGLAALIGAAASAVAIAYLWRASQTMAPLDWTLCAGMAAIAAYHLVSLVDSRTPLVVADHLGVRIRLGHEWRGLPWSAIARVAVHPRRGLVRDGRIVFVPHDLNRALEGVEGKARHQALLNQKMYGAALTVPLGITTRVPGGGEHSVVERVAALTQGRTDVVEVDPAQGPAEEAGAAATGPTSAPVAEPVPDIEPTAALSAPAEPPAPAVDEPSPEPGEQDRPARRRILGGIGTIVSRVGKDRRRDVDTEDHLAAAAAVLEPADGPRKPLPLRPTRPALRAEVTRDSPASLGNTALQPAPEESGRRDPLPESRELHRPGSVDLVFETVGSVRPIATPGQPVEPLVIDDFAPAPAYDPVIGPELAAARTRLGLSVDALAERTRIRPHVIESIEVDDFGPCGGDFFARGHLRTIARVLGKDVAPLLEAFEGRYATAPVNPRRVFEAELATGMTGSMRSTIGGPNWVLLVGVVLSLVLVWGVVRLFASEPAELIHDPAPILNGSAGIDSDYGLPAAAAPAVEPMPLTLVAAHGDTKVVVRDGDGTVVFSGAMVLGEKKRLELAPPVRVRAADGGALEVQVAGRDRGVLGVLGEPARRTFSPR